MRNVFINKYKINTKYDIKGSSVDRTASIKEKEKDLPTYKDNDLLSDNRQIVLGPEAKTQFMEKLTRDVQFLCDLKIMDYSLLIGIHENKTLQINSNQLQNDQEQQSSDQPILSSSPKNDVDAFGAGAGGGTAVGDYYSDQDNFSPGEDAEDTDDGQLNCNLFFYFFISLIILIICFCFFFIFKYQVSRHQKVPLHLNISMVYSVYPQRVYFNF